MSAIAARRPHAVTSLPARIIPVAAGVILGGTLMAATIARLTGFATLPAPPASLASLSLRFADLPDGGVAVRNAVNGAQIAAIPARDDGFLRMTLRVLYNFRLREGIGPQAAFTLTEYPGGRMALADPATGQQVELEAFGPSNVREFSEFFMNGAKP